MKKLYKSNEGFSLVELIVAVVILGIITVPLLHTLVTGANTARKGAEVSDATAAAQSLIERIKAEGAAEVYDKPSLIKSGANDDDNPTNGTRTIELPSYSSGSREYRAVVEISEDLTDETELAKSNPMDITFNMKYADGKAINDFQEAVKYEEVITETNEDGEVVVVDRYYVYPEPGLLKRSGIEIKADRTAPDNLSQPDSFDYTVTATFRYQFDGNGEFSAYSGSVSTSTQLKGVKLPKYGDAAFSVFLIYDAFFRSGEPINIKNSNSDADFNVFLVNTSDNTIPGTFSCRIAYDGQHFNDEETCVRVYTNFSSNKLTYIAKDGTHQKSLDGKITGKLVETAVEEQRRFSVTVTLYPVGGSDEIFSLETKMLI